MSLTKIGFEVKQLVLDKLQEQGIDPMDFEEQLQTINEVPGMHKQQSILIKISKDKSKNWHDMLGSLSGSQLRASQGVGVVSGLALSKLDDEVRAIRDRLNKEKEKQELISTELKKLKQKVEFNEI